MGEESSRTILLIEDNQGEVYLTKRLLEGSEFRCEVASTLASGIDAFNQTTPDLVLLDLGLPDSKGKETYFRFREACPGSRVVIWSGMEDQAIAEELKRRGARDYLVKTFLSFASERKSAFLESCRRAILTDAQSQAGRSC